LHYYSPENINYPVDSSRSPAALLFRLLFSLFGLVVVWCGPLGVA
jgi:hypothetical protein